MGNGCGLLGREQRVGGRKKRKGGYVGNGEINNEGGETPYVQFKDLTHEDLIARGAKSGARSWRGMARVARSKNQG